MFSVMMNPLSRIHQDPELTPKKRHNAIAYHRCREAQAAGIIRIAFEQDKTNIADLFTKFMPAMRLKELVQMVLW
jgi:hypothetical protein